jgi:hypothetical protein
MGIPPGHGHKKRDLYGKTPTGILSKRHMRREGTVARESTYTDSEQGSYYVMD